MICRRIPHLYISENVALYKPAYQEHPYGRHSGKMNASDAVDGLKLNLSDYTDHCVLSDDRQQTATLGVNLLSMHSIHHIKIHYMTGETEWGTCLALL